MTMSGCGFGVPFAEEEVDFDGAADFRRELEDLDGCSLTVANTFDEGLLSAKACIASKSSKWFANVFMLCNIFRTFGVDFPCPAEIKSSD
jgi:hypothetical protein